MCTELFVPQKTCHLSGRTMDLVANLPFFVVQLPAGRETSAGVYAKFDILGISFLKGGLLVDGMNRPGLCVSFLWNKYSLITPGCWDPDPEQDQFAFNHLIATLLGQCGSAAEAVSMLKNDVTCVKNMMSAMSPLIQPNLHLCFHDSTGEGYTVDFRDGTMRVHLNDVGIMTNDPSFDTMRHVLPTYFVNDKEAPMSAKEMGIPGGQSPLERFIRGAYYLRKMRRLLRQHKVGVWWDLVGVVCQPLSSDHTQSTVIRTWWKVVRDTKEHCYYLWCAEQSTPFRIGVPELEQRTGRRLPLCANKTWPPFLQDVMTSDPYATNVMATAIGAMVTWTLAFVGVGVGIGYGIWKPR
jgi:penicillin V acylase-like amidase (Ntn superfamily)